MHTEELFQDFIPECIKEFNADFEAILEKMNLEHLVVPVDQNISEQ